MNVLMVTSSYPKFPGDVTAPFLESIAEAVAERGHQVDVVLPHHPELRRPAGRVRFFPYRYAPFEAWNLWGYAGSLESDVKVRPLVLGLAPFVAGALRGAVSRRLIDQRYDVVHAHWVVPNAAFLLGVPRAHGVPLVISLHGSDVFLAERQSLVRFFARRAFAAAGAVSACSSDLGERAKPLGARPERLRTVPYGVDLESFRPRRATGTIRERFGIGSSDLFVLAVGRLVEKKGFAVLIEAASKVPGIKVVIAGGGDLRDALEREAIRLGASVVFAGPLERETLSAALAAADVVVVPSLVDRAGNVDGLPNSLLEALASGRPVIASRVAGIPDVVVDGANGLLTPPGDPAGLVAALVRLRGDPALRETLGKQARVRAERDLSWSEVARVFEEMYVEAAALDAR